MDTTNRQADHAARCQHLALCEGCGWWYCGILPCGCDLHRGLAKRGEVVRP